MFKNHFFKNFLTAKLNGNTHICLDFLLLLAAIFIAGLLFSFCVRTSWI